MRNSGTGSHSNDPGRAEVEGLGEVLRATFAEFGIVAALRRPRMTSKVPDC